MLPDRGKERKTEVNNRRMERKKRTIDRWIERKQRWWRCSRWWL